MLHRFDTPHPGGAFRPGLPRRKSRRPIRPLFRHLSLAVLALLLAGCAPTILRVADRETVTVEQLVGEIGPRRVVYAGEVHDRPAHHGIQLEIIRRLHESGTPVAIGLEMFGNPDQQALDSWVRGELDTASFLPFYRRNWENVPWELYEEIFDYARKNRIPMVALNIPKGLVRKVFRGGVESLTEEERRELPAVACDGDPRYREMIRGSFSGHGGDGEAARRLCEAQLLWNRTMAFRLAGYLREHPGVTVVVLAGGGHVIRQGGIPGELDRELGPTGQVVILPAYPPGITAANVTRNDADYLIDDESAFLKALGGF